MPRRSERPIIDGVDSERTGRSGRATDAEFNESTGRFNERDINTSFDSLRQAEEWLVEEGNKDNRVYGFPLVIYAFFLIASIGFWIVILKGLGGESIGYMCIIMPSILVSIFYLISAILVFKEKYSMAIPFTLIGFIFLWIMIPTAISGVNDSTAPLIIIFYCIVPLILFLSIVQVNKKEKDKEDILKSYFPPPPATP